ncbi:IgA FC receptor [Anabrus simplex]|uniref:IgA FC receptor n=1 Tax=Anabrus simplex TaxID=316456 RepID=UPI0035A3CF8A
MKDPGKQTNMEPIYQNSYFRNLVRKYEQRNNNLAEREAELRQRIDLLQSTLPALLVWNLWRTRQDEPVSLVDVARAISNPFGQQERSPGTAPISLPNYRTQSATERRPREIGERKRPETSPCNTDGTVNSSRNVQFDVQGAPENQPSSSYPETGGGEGALKRIRELEEERQQLIAEKEEAEARCRETEAELRAKLQELESKRETQALEIAKAAEEEYRERIRELEEELRVIKEQSQEPTITMVYGAIQYPLAADIDMACEDMFPGERPSSDSLRSCDVECMKQLQQLVENELNLKRRIAELEQKEACIYYALQSTDMVMGNAEQSIERGAAIRSGGETQPTYEIPADQDDQPREIVPTTELVATTEFSITRQIEPLTATSSRASGPLIAQYAPSAKDVPSEPGCPPCTGKCEPCSAEEEIEVEIPEKEIKFDTSNANETENFLVALKTEVEIPQPVGERDYTFDPSNANEAALYARIKELEQVISELRKVIADMENEKISMLNKYDELTQALAESERNMQKLQEEVDELQKNLSQRSDSMKVLQQGYEKETAFLKTELSTAVNDINFVSCECDAIKEEKIALEISSKPKICDTMDSTACSDKLSLESLLGDKSRFVLHAISHSGKEDKAERWQEHIQQLYQGNDVINLVLGREEAVDGDEMGDPILRSEFDRARQIQDLIGEKEELNKTIQDLNKSLAAKDEELRLAVEAAQQGVPYTPKAPLEEPAICPETAAPPQEPEVCPEPEAPPAEVCEGPAPPAAAGEPCPAGPPKRVVSHLSQVHITTCDTDFDEEDTSAPTAPVSKPPAVPPAPSAPPLEEVPPAPCEPQLPDAPGEPCPPLEEPPVCPETAAPPKEPEVCPEPSAPPAEVCEGPAPPAAAGEPCPAEPPKRVVSHLSQVHITTCDTDFDEEDTSAPTAPVSKPPAVEPAPSGPPPEEVPPAPCEPQLPDAPSVYISEQPLDSGSAYSTPPKPPEAPCTAQPRTPDSEAPAMLAGVVLAAVRKQDAENVGREVDAIVAHTKMAPLWKQRGICLFFISSSPASSLPRGICAATSTHLHYLGCCATLIFIFYYGVQSHHLSAPILQIFSGRWEYVTCSRYICFLTLCIFIASDIRLLRLPSIRCLVCLTTVCMLAFPLPATP